MLYLSFRNRAVSLPFFLFVRAPSEGVPHLKLKQNSENIVNDHWTLLSSLLSGTSPCVSCQGWCLFGICVKWPPQAVSISSARQDGNGCFRNGYQAQERLLVAWGRLDLSVFWYLTESGRKILPCYTWSTVAPYSQYFVFTFGYSLRTVPKRIWN